VTTDRPAGEADPAASPDPPAAPPEAPAASAAEAVPGRAEKEPSAARDRRARPGAAAAAGGALEGEAAELLAAVRAVESGKRSAGSFFATPAHPRAQRPGDGPSTGSPGAAQPSGATRAANSEDLRGAHHGGVRGGKAAGVPEAGPAAFGAVSVAEAEAVRNVLADGGAPEALGPQVTGALGGQAGRVLREDPWRLLAVPGVGADQADGFAHTLLGTRCGPGDPRRGRALLVWLLERAALEGHTALEPSELSAALAQRSVPEPEETVRTAIAEGAVLVFQDMLDSPRAAEAGAADDGERQPVRVLLGLDRYALAEESLADGLGRLLSTCAPEGGSAFGGEEDTGPADGADNGGSGPAGGPGWESTAAEAPSPSAAELLRAVAGSGLVTHTGGEAARAEPTALVEAARALGLRAYAAAHSEDGRRRLAERLGEAAVTVSGLLSGREGPGRDLDGTLELDVLAVLDAPQLDIETAAMLVESLADGTRLVLSGDPGVLWSAGPGRVFADVLAARVCPQVASRTPDPGPIGDLVSGIGVGELTEVRAPGKEVVIVPVHDAGEAVHRAVQLMADSVPRAIGVPSERTQVITPGHGGAAGTRALNAALKARLNPGPGRFGGFDPGDRIVYVPAPGRTLPGAVVTADAEGLHLDCEGTAVVVPRERVREAVRHGWAVTAHQAAGTRWPASVVVLPGDAARTLTRAWVYTAFGRAERHLSVVHGADQALPRAVAEVPVRDRTTRLRTLLRSAEPPPER
jgi:hypothetical protein